jgi:hypothetical protein
MARYLFVPTSEDELSTFTDAANVQGGEDALTCYQYIMRMLEPASGLPMQDVPVNVSVDTGRVLLKIAKNIGQHLGFTQANGDTTILNAVLEHHSTLNEYRRILSIGSGTRSRQQVTAVSFKPQDFPNLASDTKEYTKRQFIDQVQTSIAARDDFSLPLKAYLNCLTEYFEGNCPEAEVRRVYQAARPYIPKHDNLIVDFGEILAPMCFLHDTVSRSEPYLYNNPKIILPSRGNEPLVDFYLIEDPHGKVGFSVKALRSSATNTIKPGPFMDVIQAYGTRGKYEIALKTRPEKAAYNLYKTLAFAPTGYKAMIGAAMKLANDDSSFARRFMPSITDPGRIATMGFRAQGTVRTTLMEAFGAGVVQSQLRTLISQYCASRSRLQQYAGQTDYSLQNLAYVCEQIIISANDEGLLSFSSMFREYVLKKVVYVKMDINSTSGVPSCHVMTYHNIPKNQTITLRSKNSFNGFQDMIGMQP